MKSVMIMGGGRIAFYLAKALQEMHIRVKLVEISHERCLELAERLPEALIIHGDGSDEQLLLSENLSEMNAFVAITGRDEDNLIATLAAKQNGVRKVIAKINRLNYSPTIKSLGIDSIVSPKLITANYIMRYVRGLKNAMGNPVNTLYKIMNEQAEAMEFIASKTTQFLNIPLKNLAIRDDILVAAIARRNKVIIAHGDDVIKSGDSVILIAKNKALHDLNEIVRAHE